MIKKILTALFCLVLIAPTQSVGASLRITDANAFLKVLEKHFPGDKETQAKVANVYLKKRDVKISTDAGVGIGLEMCKVAGLVDVHDLSTDPLALRLKEKAAAQVKVSPMPYGVGYNFKPTGEDIYYPNAKCKELVTDIVWAATGLYYNLCGVHDRSHIKGAAACYKVFEELNISQAAATTLAKEYMRVKKGADDVVCKVKHRTVSDDDYIACKSAKKRAYYEFKFDDVKESFDDKIHEDIIKGIGKIYTLINVSQEKCEKDITATAKLFAASVKYKKIASTGICGIYFKELTNANQLKTACGIDNFRFCAADEIQIKTNTGIQLSMAQYVANQCGVDVSTVWCTSGGMSYTGAGCNADAWFDGGDDVISCYAGDTQIDFVLDDINEWSDVKSNSGQQGVQCLGADGEFDGSRCTMLSEKACNDMQAINAETCPDCKEIYWDAEKSICVLGSSQHAERLQQTLDVLTTVGTIAGSVVVVVVTGGTALAVVGTVMVAVGGTTAMVSDAFTESDIDTQIEDMNRCNEPECAEEYLKNTLQRLNGLKASMTANQGKTADALVSKLIGLLPPDSAYLAKIIEGCVDPNGGDEIPEACPLYEKSYTASQIVGWTGQALEFIGGVILVVDGIMQWQKTAKTIADKVDDLKQTGWIREGNHWRHQKTGEMLDKLPREGVIGWDPNPNLRGGGRWRGHMYGAGNQGSFTKVAEVHAYVETLAGRGVNWFEVAAGSAAAVDALNNKGYEGSYVLPGNNATKTTGVPVVSEQSSGGNNTSTPEQKKSGAVIVGTGTADKQVPQSTSGANNTSAPELVWDSDVEIEDEEIVVEDPVFDFSNDNLNVGKVSAPSTKSDAKKVKPHAVKDPRKTGLIATAAVLGAVGTGLLVGGLVSRDKDDDKKASSAQSAKNTALERELETILNNSNASLGFVNGNMIKLVPMATVENTQAKIVNINANVVVVVDYRGHNIPFYANSSSSSWVPVLGIGVNGGWFNVYPTSVLPGFVVQIQNLLNQKLNPGTVGQFVVANALGVQFPIPTAAAYNVINAEFPKGVVQKYTTPMSAADKTLYDNNYNRMKKLS